MLQYVIQAKLMCNDRQAENLRNICIMFDSRPAEPPRLRHMAEEHPCLAAPGFAGPDCDKSLVLRMPLDPSCHLGDMRCQRIGSLLRLARRWAHRHLVRHRRSLVVRSALQLESKEYKVHQLLWLALTVQ